jgi:hypothetical protein
VSNRAGPFFFAADKAPVTVLCEAISDWFGVSVLAAPDVGAKTVSGRLLCLTLGEAMDSLGVLTGERWRPLAPGIVVLGAKGERSFGPCRRMAWGLRRCEPFCNRPMSSLWATGS